MSRLEEIKQYLVLLHNAIDVDEETKDYIFKDLKVEWLIERVQELEEQNQGLRIMYDARLAKFDKVESQNKRYREVLNRIRITTKEETTHRWVRRALEGDINERHQGI